MRFPIPDAALAQHLAILGKTGSGKTSIAKGAVEHLVSQGARVCILDPIKSDWWGLTSSADGKKPGLPFQILGGPRGHVPLHASSGKVIADLVASGALPLCILDMADFPPGGMAQFFNDFAPALLHKIKGVVHLVLEEAHEFAPKERAGIGNENMLIHNAKKLATAGRSQGLRLMLATQRIQSLHNALLGSCDTMVALRLTAPADQKPVVDWLKANLDKDRAAEIAASLSKLKTGTGWVCSPDIEDVELIQFPRPKTYDNSATPEAGAIDRNDVRTAAVDVANLRRIVGDAVAEAQANDPAALKAEITKLTGLLAAEKAKPGVSTELASNVAAKSNVADQRAQERALAAARAEGVREGTALGWNSCLDTLRPLVSAAGQKLMVDFEAAGRRLPSAPKVPKLPSKGPSSTSSAHSVPSKPASAAAPPRHGGPQDTFLRVLAWWEAMGHPTPTRAQVAAMAGWKVTAGHLNNVSGRARSEGLIDYPSPGLFALTPAGRAAAPAPDMSATLVDSLAATLSGPQKAVMETLLEHGRRMSRADLCDRLSWNPTAGHVNNVLGSLRTLHVIDYPDKGQVELEDWVQ